MIKYLIMYLLPMLTLCISCIFTPVEKRKQDINISNDFEEFLQQIDQSIIISAVEESENDFYLFKKYLFQDSLELDLQWPLKTPSRKNKLCGKISFKGKSYILDSLPSLEKVQPFEEKIFTLGTATYFSIYYYDLLGNTNNSYINCSVYIVKITPSEAATIQTHNLDYSACGMMPMGDFDKNGVPEIILWKYFSDTANVYKIVGPKIDKFDLYFLKLNVDSLSNKYKINWSQSKWFN